MGTAMPLTWTVPQKTCAQARMLAAVKTAHGRNLDAEIVAKEERRGNAKVLAASTHRAKHTEALRGRAVAAAQARAAKLPASQVRTTMRWYERARAAGVREGTYNSVSDSPQ